MLSVELSAAPMLSYSILNSQFKTYKFKMRKAHNSKLKTQNCKNDFLKTVYYIHEDWHVQLRWRLRHAVAHTQRDGCEECLAHQL